MKKKINMKMKSKMKKKNEVKNEDENKNILLEYMKDVDDKLFF